MQICLPAALRRHWQRRRRGPAVWHATPPAVLALPASTPPLIFIQVIENDALAAAVGRLEGLTLLPSDGSNRSC